MFAGDVDPAIRDFLRTVELDPTYVAAYSNLGVLYERTQDLEAAVDAYTRAGEILPDAGLYIVRGQLYYRLDQPELALADFATALELDPSLAPAYNYRGDVFVSQEAWIDALVSYNEALRLDPTRTHALFGRGTIYALLGKTAWAIADLEAVIDMAPDGELRTAAEELLAQLRE